MIKLKHFSHKKRTFNYPYIRPLLNIYCIGNIPEGMIKLNSLKII